MTMDELLHLAYAVQNDDARPIIVFTFDELAAFARVFAENEREACAQLVDDLVAERAPASTYSRAIRARGSE